MSPDTLLAQLLVAAYNERDQARQAITQLQARVAELEAKPARKTAAK